MIEQIVPPNSPNSRFSFDIECVGLPEFNTHLEGFIMPKVREIGVKATIDYLAEYFQCKEYKISMSQFWFLDIVAECIWRSQDEYFFPEEYQFLVLKWVLYVFNLIRDKPFLTRKEIFTIFTETVSVADELIQSGQNLKPPEMLFELKIKDDFDSVISVDSVESKTSLSTTKSSISLASESSKNLSCIAMEFDEKTEFFKIPKALYTNEIDCLSSDIETRTMTNTDVMKKVLKEPTALEENEEEIHVYEENKNTSISSSTDIPDIDSDESDFDYNGFVLGDISSKQSQNIDDEESVCNHFTKKISSTIRPIIEKEEQITKAWFDYHIWQSHINDMNSDSKGWLPEFEAVIDEPSEVFDEGTLEYFMEYMGKYNYARKRTNENIFINLCALMSVKQLVFDYFYESFQFMMIKFLFNSKRYVTTQVLNDFWCTPKRIKTEMKRPLKRKPIKPKKPKKEKKKKSKSSKKSKKTKSKSSKKSSKSSKKSKKSKDKKKKLTKEEKEELARIKREQEELEEKLRLLAENKVFMFPLGDATTDEFFQKIFPNWTRPVEKKKKSKKGKKKK